MEDTLKFTYIQQKLMRMLFYKEYKYEVFLSPLLNHDHYENCNMKYCNM